jgi:hypothetical protein
MRLGRRRRRSATPRQNEAMQRARDSWKALSLDRHSVS